MDNLTDLARRLRPLLMATSESAANNTLSGIQRWRAGRLAQVYDANDTGLTAALADAVDGDGVMLSASAITGGSWVVPAGVSLKGMGERSILAGAITVTGEVRDLRVTGAASITGYARGCRFEGGVTLSAGNMEYCLCQSFTGGAWALELTGGDASWCYAGGAVDGGNGLRVASSSSRAFMCTAIGRIGCQVESAALVSHCTLVASDSVLTDAALKKQTAGLAAVEHCDCVVLRGGGWGVRAEIGGLSLAYCSYPSILGEANVTWAGPAAGAFGGYLATLAGALTAGRTYTLPDQSGTLGMLERAQTWTAAQTYAAQETILTGETAASLALLAQNTGGTELITAAADRDFSAGNHWSGTNWSTASGALVHTAGSSVVANLTNPNLTAGSILAGRYYLVTFTISGMTAGTVAPRLGTASGGAFAADGTYTGTILAAANDAALNFLPLSTFNGTIDNVSLTRLPAVFALLGNGHTGVGTANPDSDSWYHVQVYDAGTAKFKVENRAQGSGAAAAIEVKTAHGGRVLLIYGGLQVSPTTTEAFWDRGALITDPTIGLGLALAARQPAGDIAFYAGGVANTNRKWTMANSGALDGLKAGITEEGGFYTLLTAGENLSRGQVVMVSTTADGQVVRNAVNSDTPLGVVYADALSGAAVKIVTNGTAYVLPESGITAARGNVIYSSDAEAGRVDQSPSIPGVTQHWREIGHFIENGTGTGVIARAVLHFN